MDYEITPEEVKVKLDAGEAVVYPASRVHFVAPVTRGFRLAAVCWIQSIVHDERIREVLSDMSRAIASKEVISNPEVALLLSKSYHNLLRYASEP